MLDHDPFDVAEQMELEELSEAVRDEEATRARANLPVLHEVIDELAERVAQRTCVGVIVLDGSALGAWERQHGAAAFAAVMGRLAELTFSLRGPYVSTEDIVCFDAIGGDMILIFLSQPQGAAASSLASVDFEDIGNRIKERLFEPFTQSQLFYHQALDLIVPGSALILHNSSVDPRREIYRAVRRARQEAQTHYKETLRRRHRVVGHMIAHRKIQTLYQPIYSLPGREVLGYEALSRAEQSDAQKLGGHLFVAASKAELDGELDQTCRTLSIYRRPKMSPGQKLFINCLPPTFYEPMRELEQLIARWLADGLSPDQLVFEVTESITHEQALRILPSVRKLRDRGFLFALDDVGTGAANLRLLADLEPDYVKMDLNLTIGIAESTRKQALASYLLDLARRSQARLIAEGIETDEDLATLVGLGIEIGQGYLLGRPKPPEDYGV
jgi:EAL domain-containing protein (putative c-di-GMP-specific phosphodiesterase class I)